MPEFVAPGQKEKTEDAANRAPQASNQDHSEITFR